MPKMLRIAVLSLGALALTASLALAQATPEPGSDPGKAPAATQSTPHKGKGKKGGKRKGGKRKGKKAGATQPQ